MLPPRMLRTFCLDSGSFGEGIPAAETGVTSWGLCCSCYAKAEPGYKRRCPANSPRVPGAVVLLGSGEGLGCAGFATESKKAQIYTDNQSNEALPKKSMITTFSSDIP